MPQSPDLKSAVKTLRKRMQDVKADLTGIREEVRDATTTLLPGRMGVVRQKIAERRRLLKERQGPQ